MLINFSDVKNNLIASHLTHKYELIHKPRYYTQTFTKNRQISQLLITQIKKKKEKKIFYEIVELWEINIDVRNACSECNNNTFIYMQLWHLLYVLYESYVHLSISQLLHVYARIAILHHIPIYSLLKHFQFYIFIQFKKNCFFKAFQSPIPSRLYSLLLLSWKCYAVTILFYFLALCINSWLEFRVYK